MKLLATLTLAAVTSTGSLARADSHDTPAPATDERTALALSIGGALAGPALFAAGAVALDNTDLWSNREDDSLALPTTLLVSGIAVSVVGPSFGHWYAGKLLTPGMAMRAGGLAVATAGAVGVVGDCELDNTCGGVIIAAGLATFVGGAVYDIVTAPGRVRERNTRALTVLPVVKARGGGLAVAGTF